MVKSGRSRSIPLYVIVHSVYAGKLGSISKWLDQVGQGQIHFIQLCTLLMRKNRFLIMYSVYARKSYPYIDLL